jgi:transcriptional regulator with XRE-family HTH domain
VSDAEVLLAIGARIRLARRSLGLLQREVGDLLRVTGVSVGNWERGKTSPTALNVVRLAETLGVTVAWLLLGEAAA